MRCEHNIDVFEGNIIEYSIAHFVLICVITVVSVGTAAVTRQYTGPLVEFKLTLVSLRQRNGSRLDYGNVWSPGYIWPG